MTPPGFEPRDPEFAARVRASFARQKVMETFGARLRAVSPGEVEIELPFRDDLTQQNGFLHAGVVATIADSACGYAAFSLMPADASVLSVEFKLNLLAPARGERLVARARVLRPGRTITVCACDVVAVDERGEKLVATLLGTMMALRGRADLAEAQGSIAPDAGVPLQTT
jgi:uncharacterized protein (TIGR00369 family)